MTRTQFMVQDHLAPPARLGREQEPDPPPRRLADADLEQVPGRGDIVEIGGDVYVVSECRWTFGELLPGEQHLAGVRVVLLPKSRSQEAP